MLYLCVALTRDILGDFQAQCWHILPFYSVRVMANSEESYADAIAQLRTALAYMHIWGELDFDNAPITTDPAEVRAVIDALTEEEKIITPKDTQRVRSEVAEQEKRVSGGLKKLIQFMDAQAQDENITVGEALRRAEEGTEQMRRIVEGEEPGADPEGGKEGKRPSDPA